MILDFAHVLAAINAIGHGISVAFHLYYLIKYRHTTNGKTWIILSVALLSLTISASYVIVFFDLFQNNDPPINVLLLRLTMFGAVFIFCSIPGYLITKNESSNIRECQDKVAKLENELSDKLTAIDLKDKTIKLLHDMLDQEKQHHTSH